MYYYLCVLKNLVKGGGNVGTVQQKIYEILDEKHMTQAKVARAAGISPKLFNAMLRGRKLLRPEYICPIAEALGTTPDILFGFSTDNEK